jgi:membrane protease YdiL (CAAX protease family)
MTFLVWAPWRLLQREQRRPRAIYFVSAIVISSVVFGLGHLPIASALGVEFTASIVSYVVIANSVFGLIAGYLYWKKGLEAAIIGHIVTHILIVTAVIFTACTVLNKMAELGMPESYPVR